MLRFAPALLIGLVMALAGCDPVETHGDRRARPALAPDYLAAEAGPTDPADALAPWKADSCPWVAFPRGSWAHYRYESGLEERWWVVDHTNARVHVAVQVRKSRTDEWEGAVLHLHLSRKAWPLVTEVGAAPALPVATRSGTRRIDATLRINPRLAVIVAPQVPGGVVLEGTPVPDVARLTAFYAGGSLTLAMPHYTATRRLLGYGVGAR